MLKFIFYIGFFVSFSTLYAQDTSHVHEHQEHQDESGYYCSACKHHLFNENDVIKKDGEFHYHVLSTDSSQTRISCASCSKNLGFYNKNDSSYQIQLNSIQKSEATSEYSCIACSSPLFDEEQLIKSDHSHIYFSKPIKENLIDLNSSNFYKIEDSNALCKNCDHYLGRTYGSKSDNFGIRIKLGSVFKK